MVNSFFQDVIDFHKKFGIDYDGKPRELPEDLLKFRHDRLIEEVGEIEIAMQLLDRGLHFYDGSRIVEGLDRKLDGLVDLIYIALGTARLHGFDFEEAWRRVHAANMAKASARDFMHLSKYKNPNDVVKPPGWEPPDLRDLVIDHVYKNQVR